MAVLTIYRRYWLLLFLPISMYLASCGGGSGGGSANVLTGRFIDSSVAGLRYESGSLSGYTDIDGRFQYQEGSPVTFYVGQIRIGTAQGASIVTPLSLVPNAADESNETVLNIARFIQSLDDNLDTSDGIWIPSLVDRYADSMVIDFTLPPDQFSLSGTVQMAVGTLTSLTSFGSHPLITTDYAKQQLQIGLLETLAGVYTDAFPAYNNTDWRININETGTITGGVYNKDGNGVLDIIGYVYRDRSVRMLADSIDDSYLFSGNITLDHQISGDWAQEVITTDPLTLAKASGCFACHAIDAKVVGPSWNDVAAFYAGDMNARDYLIQKVKKGGKGNWTSVTGGVPMPPYYPRVSQRSIAILVDYILALNN